MAIGAKSQNKAFYVFCIYHIKIAHCSPPGLGPGPPRRPGTWWSPGRDGRWTGRTLRSAQSCGSPCAPAWRCTCKIQIWKVVIITERRSDIGCNSIFVYLMQMVLNGGGTYPRQIHNLKVIWSLQTIFLYSDLCLHCLLFIQELTTVDWVGVAARRRKRRYGIS